MNIDQWHEMSKPISNKCGEPFGVCLGDDEQIVHQIYGVDMEAVLNANSKCVWTLLNVDGEGNIVEGGHFVNREGYLFTSVPYTDEFVEIPIYTDTDEEDDSIKDDAG